MNLLARPNRNRALTLTEVMLAVAILLILGALALVMVVKTRRPHPICVNNQKQVGLAFRVFSNDNDDKFPYSSPTNSDAIGLVNLAYRNESDAWIHFLVMSNDLGAAKILICPDDSARLGNVALDFSSNSIAPNFGLQFKRNLAVSYFVGLDADETRPQMLLAGDRNLVTAPSNTVGSVMFVTSGGFVRWSSAIHTNAGNVTLADGSVQQMTTPALQAYLRISGIATNRLLMP